MAFRCSRHSARWILGPVVAVGLLTAPASAPAGTVGLENGPEVVFRAAAGERNDVTVLDVAQQRMSITDPGAPLGAGPGCDAGVLIICAGSTAIVHLGNRDDRGITQSAHGLRLVHGEGGNDFIRSDGETAYAYGGPGRDDIGVSAHLAYAYGGPGADSVHGNASLYNDLRGERGDDQLVQGGSATCARLDGGPGEDRMVGRKTSCNGPVIPTQTGGNGEDRLGFAASARASSEQWILEGGRGHDLINAAGSGAGDVVSCGRGHDRVVADPTDSVAPDCERVRAGAA
jgi:hypothetical protein